MALEAGAEVWVPCDAEIWRPGLVLGFEDTSAGEVVVVEVKGKGSGKGHRPIVTREEVRVPRPKATGSCQLHLRNEVLRSNRGALELQDLGLLPLLHEPAVLHALQLRFQQDAIYTLTGPMLLAVNPFKALPQLYGAERLEAVIRQIRPEAQEKEPEEPHIYAVAKAAYEGVWHRAVGQTVLVSGESGAGKTETTKFVMRFLALAGAGGAEASMSTVERQVLDSIPVLEALGNAKTLRNENSSRFGKYIELQFKAAASAPRLVGAHTHTYLLEKVRVVHQQERERSFHIFYQLLAAAEREEQGSTSVCGVPIQEPLSSLQVESFRYLRGSKCWTLDEDVDEAQLFDATVKGMRHFGLEEHLPGILQTLLAVLHLGNVTFEVPKTNSEASAAELCAPLCNALGLDPQKLEAAFCTRTMQAPGEGVITMPNTVEKAADSRDSLARHLYDALFTFVVARINATVSETGGAAWSKAKSKLLPFVGVLDIFGFEFFEQNSLEQLFINFTNELLQQYFNEVIFEHEAELYRREGIQWDPLDFPDNHAIVDLVGKAPMGILPMLDEECITTGGSSEKWCSKLCKAHGSHGHFGVVKLNQHNFIVRHFAGPVEYMSKSFVEKNRDALGADLVKCLKASSKPFVQQLVSAADRSFGTTAETTAQGATRRTRAKRYTVASEFQGQLQNLMERIRATEPHFVRCIKPNAQSSAGIFERRGVVQQLQYQGVLQAIEVSRVGFPVRLKHRQAVMEFKCLTADRAVEAQAARGQLAAAAKLLFEGLTEPSSPMSPRTPRTPKTPIAPQTPRTPRRASVAATSGAAVCAKGTWAVGKTLVFLKREAVEALSHALSKCRRLAAVQLEAFARGRLQRRRFVALRRAVLRLQCAARVRLARRRVAELRRNRAARVLQSWRRGQVARTAAERQRRAVAFVQAWAKARSLRRRLLRQKAAARRLQRFWCRRMLTVHIKRRVASAVAAQRLWRGHRGRQRAEQQRLDDFRKRRAAHLILQAWRHSIVHRVLEKDLDEFFGQAGKDAINQKIQSRLQVSSRGQLHATVGFLRAKVQRSQRRLQKLRAQEEALQAEAQELNGWTFLGMLRRFFHQVFHKVCGQARRMSPGIELGQPLLEHG
ncbi:unnamed protein product [Effrenium voratum]|nr:unnamed protein product [Effrenium voratum]